MPQFEGISFFGNSFPNVWFASQCKERTIIINPETQETLVPRVIFYQRGFPLFNPYVKIKTRIRGDLSSMSREVYIRAATRQLREDVLSGKIDRKMFTDSEWIQIKGEKAKIGGYTWHHHQETGRMQLVPDDIHDWIRHVEGNK